MTEHVSIAENFNKYFEVLFANTESLRQESFRIRHRVYCEELGWEPKQDNGLETDPCDDYSFALLLVHKRTGQYAGTARLVISPPEKPEKQLPFEMHCLQSVFHRPFFGKADRLPRWWRPVQAVSERRYPQMKSGF